MLAYESGKADYRKISDTELCQLIDKRILPEYGATSIYHLTLQEKQRIANYLFSKLHISESRIRRCLALFE